MCKHLIASTAKTVVQVLIFMALGALMYCYVDTHHNEPTVPSTDTELSSKAIEDSLFKANDSGKFNLAMLKINNILQELETLVEAHQAVQNMLKLSIEMDQDSPLKY